MEEEQKETGAGIRRLLDEIERSHQSSFSSSSSSSFRGVKEDFDTLKTSGPE